MDSNRQIVPVNSSKNAVQSVKRVVKRRRKLLILMPLLFVILSLAVLYVVEPKYESSTSILVQQDEMLNPLVMFDITGDAANSEDRLESFNEIIYSRSTLEKLIDSLNLDRDIRSEPEKKKLVEKVRDNIKTELRASDSFEIIYQDEDPVRARDGAALLADHFIETRSKLDDRRNSETVNFFQTKIEELEQMVDSQRTEIVKESTEEIKEQPVDQTALQARLQNIDVRLDELEWQIIQEENRLKILEGFLNQDSQNFTVQSLYKLSMEEIPLGSELGRLLEEYNQLRQQFTDNYPEVSTTRTRILEIAKRVPSAIETKLASLKTQKNELSQKRSAVIEDMEKSFITAQRNNNQESDFSVYQELYKDMKVKLEQVRMASELDQKASDQFVMLDQPYISEEPTSPNRSLVVTAGFIIGLILAGILIWVTEFFDTTVRSEQDLEYQKPIIAYLNDG